MIRKNRARKSSSWDPKSDCIFCARPAYMLSAGYEPDFAKWIKPYVHCNYCTSKTWYFASQNFTDDIKLGRKNRKAWDFMKEMQQEFAWLSCAHSALTWEIRKMNRGIK